MTGRPRTSACPRTPSTRPATSPPSPCRSGTAKTKPALSIVAAQQQHWGKRVVSALCPARNINAAVCPRAFPPCSSSAITTQADSGQVLAVCAPVPILFCSVCRHSGRTMCLIRTLGAKSRYASPAPRIRPRASRRGACARTSTIRGEIYAQVDSVDRGRAR